MAVVALAQEAVTSAPVITSTDWKDLVRQIDKLEQGYNQQFDNIKAINRCAERGMFYVPGYAADPQQCKAA